MEIESHQVNAISDNDFGEVLEQEKLEEGAFLVESSMSIGSSYWCRPTPTIEHRPTPTTEHRSTSTAEHRSTSSTEHRSTPLLGSDKTVRIQNNSDFAFRHPRPPTLARVTLDDVNRQATKEEIPFEKRVKSRKPYIPKHLRREVNKEELEGFHKRVKRVPKDMCFQDAYHKYRVDSLSVVPLHCQAGSLEYRVRCRGDSEPFTKVRVLCDPELREKGEVSARAFLNCINKIRKSDTETCFGASQKKKSEEDEFARGSMMAA
uniref:Uncharacterized protein n=1 Tax=Brassica oleracea var. oleracea TaxID=109376 RepID=A0A0D3D4B4_BRAOL